MLCSVSLAGQACSLAHVRKTPASEAWLCARLLQGGSPTQVQQSSGDSEGIVVIHAGDSLGHDA
eukprot:4437896-Amphidinium_carterae.1